MQVRLIRWDRSFSSFTNPTSGQIVFDLDCTSGVCVDRYTPQTAERETRDDVVNYTDGGEVEYSAWRNVNDVLDLTFDSDRSAYHEVQRIIEDAVFAQRDRRYPRVFIAYMSAVDGQWWYSEILSGRLVADTATTYDTDTNIGRFRARLEILRRFYWENDPALLTLVQGASSGTVMGVGSSGAAAALPKNYVDILAANIDGVLPAPVTLYVDPVDPVFGSTIYDTRWALGRGLRPFLYQHHHDVLLPPASVGNVEVLAYGIVIPATTTDNAGGGWYQVVACVRSSGVAAIPPNAQFRTELVDPLSGEAICASALVEVPTQDEGVFSIGLLKIPPRPLGLAGPCELRIYARYPSQIGMGTLDIDAIQIVPTDSFRLWRTDYDPIPATVIIDNMIDDTYYVRYPSGVGYNLLWPEYGKIFLWPRRDQRLIAIPADINGNWDDSLSFELRIEYRQRRLNV